MVKKEFKTESKRLLDLMIHSIYTNREIFLRELISNASDAIDKLYFKSLTDTSIGIKKEDFCIKITADKDSRKLTISDNGIGMTKEELEGNLGVIAKSGSLDFKKDNELNEDVDIIGQFGVGFYSSFMVAETVTVISKAHGSDEAYKWTSSGADGYTIEECDKQTAGTEIILDIKENTEESEYDEFLEQYRIQAIVKRYSDYVRFPVKMDMEREKLKEGTEDEYENYIETVTLNSMVPIWKKNKAELKSEDYENFYKEKFMDYESPITYIHSKNEGTATYNSLLYIPKKAPYDFYTKEYEKGLQLYSSGVLIMEKCSDLLPDYFSFVRGLVDSEDLSLNISREILQQDRQLKIIAKNIEKSIKNELTKLMKNDREKYEEFFKAFGIQLKFGIYNGYGMNKKTLQDLILFTSSFEKKLVSLSEYVSRMKEDQKYIYFASGESVSKIELLPQTELVREKGYEILYLTENVDEFAIQMMMDYEGKQFKSVSSSDLDMQTPEEKEELDKQAEDSKDMFDEMKNFLGDKISKVRLSHRLKSHPVCLTSEGHVSLEMEKVLNSMPTNENKVKAEKVLEINASHKIFDTLKALNENDKNRLEKYTKLLYNQALLIEGLSVEDPVELSNLICELMV